MLLVGWLLIAVPPMQAASPMPAMPPAQANNITTTQAVTVASGNADLVLTVTDSPDPLTEGSSLTYDILITNTGPALVNNVIFTATVDSALLPQGRPANGASAAAANVGVASFNCVLVETAFICGTGPIAPGNRFKASLSLTPSETGTLETIFDATPLNATDPNLADNRQVIQTEVLPAVADLTLTKAVNSSSVAVGQPVIYTLTLTNNGPTTAFGVTLVDQLPTGLAFESVAASQGSCNFANMTLSCSVGTLDASQQMAVTLTAIPTVTGPLTTTATAQLSIGSDPTTPNLAEQVITVMPLEAVVTPSTAATLAYTDSNSHTLRVELPVGAVDAPSTVSLSPLLQPTVLLTGLTGHNFQLAVQQGGTPIPNYPFQQPVPITIQYSEAALAGLGLDEETLTLYYRNATLDVWQDAGQTCPTPTPPTRDLVNNEITVTVCRAGEFALAAEGNVMFYLPTIYK